MEFTDLHSHILPGIDDGSPDMATSLAIARKAVEAGVVEIVCTPHIMPPDYDNDRDTIKRAVEALASELTAEGIPIRLSAGGEVYFSFDLPGRMERGELPLIGREYLLIEFPMQEVPASGHDLLFALQLKGASVILAHPERNQGIMEDLTLASRLVERDVRLLLNSGSLLGRYGGDSKKTAMDLISRGLVTAVASDSHRNPEHMLTLPRAFDEVERIFGTATAKALFETNPGRIARGKSVRRVKPAQDNADRETSGREEGVGRGVPARPGRAGSDEKKSSHGSGMLGDAAKGQGLWYKLSRLFFRSK